jgi:hypothetical protein
MSDAGWGVLFVLVLLLLCTCGEGLFFILLGILILWMWAEYKKTGEQPDLTRMVNRLFSGGTRGGGRGRRRR